MVLIVLLSPAVQDVLVLMLFVLLCVVFMHVLMLMLVAVAELRWPEGPPSGAPYSYRKEKETQ